MRKTMIFLMSAFLLAFASEAGVVTLDQAEQTAEQFVNKKSTKFKKSADNSLKLAHQGLAKDGTPDYYVFNRGENGGFIVVSGEDRAQAVCGYCDRGSFDFKKLPINVRAWFSEYQRQMQYMREHPQVKARKSLSLETTVDPLITTKWDQCKPYNDFCPESISDDDPYWVYGGRACAGCVAIALCQVMNYYQWPVHGYGSKTYDFYLDGETPMTLSADFSQSYYQWDLMKDEYLYMDKNYYGYFDENWHVYIKIIDENGDTIPDPNGMYGNAVAKLVSDVGIGCEMGYGSAGSGAYTYYAYYALIDYFKYMVGYAYRDEYEGDWDAVLREELDMQHPMYYSGHGSGGHAFVVDGYDEQGLFHINWGWGGWYDGYFETLALNPDGGDDGYNSYQEVMSFTPYIPLTSIPETGETIDFGYASVNSSVTRTVNVSGLWLDESVDLTVTITGDDADQFQTVNSLSAFEANLDGGMTFGVTYQPTARGNHLAELQISGYDYYGNPTDPIILTLTGHTGLYYDANEDGNIDVDDITFAIMACLNITEVNYLGRVPDIDDITELISYVLNH